MYFRVLQMDDGEGGGLTLDPQLRSEFLMTSCRSVGTMTTRVVLIQNRPKGDQGRFSRNQIADFTGWLQNWERAGVPKKNQAEQTTFRQVLSHLRDEGEVVIGADPPQLPVHSSRVNVA